MAYWKLNENIVTTVYDAIGGHTGTILGDPLWLRRGVSKSALSFDGLNNYIEVPWRDDYSITGALSLEAWVYINGPAGGQGYPQHYVIDSRDGSPYNGFGMNVDYEKVQFWIGERYLDGFYADFPLQTWFHLVCTCDGTATLVYLNGAKIGESNDSLGPISASTGPLFIGQRFTANERLDGGLDEVAISNRALTGADVLKRYQSFLK